MTQARVPLALALTAALMTASCGSRLDTARLAAGAGQAPGTLASSASTDAGASNPTSTGTAAQAPTTLSTRVAPAADTPAGQRETSPKKTVTAPGTTNRCAASLAPVRLGQTLAASGLVGAAIGNLRQGVQLWASDVNSRGGVQCHPVELTSLDDGSDPARVSSNFNDLVNGRHVVAMLAVGAPIADSAVKSSAERLQVPVVGGDLNSSIWYSSAFVFPQGAAVIPTFAGAVKEAAASRHAKRAGLLYCVEANICGLVNQSWAYITQKAGVQRGLAKAMSITQSDYTAECQALKDDHVDVVFAGMDGSAVSRVARSCAALGYFPPIAAPALAINPQVAQDPNIQKDTIWLGGANIPFLTSDTPGGLAFHRASDRFLPGQALDQSTLAGWASGKLFEAALASVAAEARRGPITTALVLKGLGLVREETLGGLAAPLTFTHGKPAPIVPCYFPLKIDASGFSAPNGSRASCFS